MHANWVVTTIDPIEGSEMVHPELTASTRKFASVVTTIDPIEGSEMRVRSSLPEWLPSCMVVTTIDPIEGSEMMKCDQHACSAYRFHSCDDYRPD
jgi:hypothetical protein